MVAHGWGNDSLCFSCARLCFLSAILNLYKYGPNVEYLKKLKSFWSFWPAWPSFCPNLAQFQTHPNYWWNRYMVRILERDIEKCWVNRVNEKICRSEFAAGRPFWIWTSWNFSWYIPTWHCTFCSIVMV